MRKGIDFFSIRDSAIDERIYEAEKKMKLVFPPLYKEFLLKYIQGEGALNREMTYKREYDRWEIAGSVVYKNDTDRPISVYYFFDLDQLVNTWESIDKYEETGTQENIINIGMLSSDPNGGLYVGYGKHNIDKIYRVNWDLGQERFSIIASSIWEFVEGLEEDYSNS